MVEQVDKALRDFVRYTGDGLPNEPVGHPLPVGDPASGPHQPRRKELRDALNATVGEAIAAIEGDAAAASASAIAAADSATQAALYDGPWLDSAADIPTDTSLTYAPGTASSVVAGDYVRTRAEGFAYEVADSAVVDHHVETAGGVKLYVLPVADGYDVRAFGAACDGVTDDAAPLQIALSLGAATGRNIFLPSGSLAINSAVTLDLSAAVAIGNENRASIVGGGSGNSEILGLSASAKLDIIGSITGAHSAVRGVKFNACPVRADQLAFMRFDDVLFYNCTTGLTVEDVLSSRFVDVRFVECGIGMDALPRADWSNPNSLSFFGCVWRNNTNIGFRSQGGAAITIYGGSIEGNGTNSGASDRGGIRIINPGVGGGIALAMHGVYVEDNRGTSDIQMLHGDQPCTYTFNSCVFNRTTPADFTTYNINLVTGAGDSNAILSVSACSFRNYGGIVPTTSQRYINIVDDGNVARADYRGNYYGTIAAAPSTYGSGEVMASFAGASPTLANSNNVSAIVRNSIGDYTITFKQPVRTPRMLIVTLSEIGDGVLVANTDTTVRLRTYDGAGALFDPATVWVRIDV